MKHFRNDINDGHSHSQTLQPALVAFASTFLFNSSYVELKMVSAGKYLTLSS